MDSTTSAREAKRVQEDENPFEQTRKKKKKLKRTQQTMEASTGKDSDDDWKPPSKKSKTHSSQSAGATRQTSVRVVTEALSNDFVLPIRMGTEAR